jgi:hypothetical protein
VCTGVIRGRYGHDEQVSADENLTGQVVLVWVPAPLPASLARLEARHGGQVLGDLDYRACPVCRVAVLEHVRVDPEQRHQRLGSFLVRSVLAAHHDYDWSATQLDTVSWEFWDGVDWPALEHPPRWCPHMHAADERAP